MSLRTTLDFVAAVSAGSEMTIKRSKADFLADRINKAAMTTATSTGFAETLMRGMQVDLGKIGSERFGAFLSVENGPAVVAWLRAAAGNWEGMSEGLADENVRLREALQRIADKDWKSSGPYSEAPAKQGPMGKIATHALDPQPPASEGEDGEVLA